MLIYCCHLYIFPKNIYLFENSHEKMNENFDFKVQIRNVLLVHLRQNHGSLQPLFLENQENYNDFNDFGCAQVLRR